HRLGHAAGLGLQPAGRRQRGPGRRRRGVFLRAGDAGAGAGLRGMASADAAARGDPGRPGRLRGVVLGGAGADGPGLVGAGAGLFGGAAVTLLVALWPVAVQRRPHRGLDATTLRDAGLRFLPRERVEQVLQDAPAEGPVPAATEARLERELAAVLGSASA